MGSIITKRIVHWAAQECSWQQSGELSVACMIDGWLFAHRRRKQQVRFDDIMTLGYLIEPKKNVTGIRTVDVRVGWNVKFDPVLVPNALESLVKNQPSLALSESDAVEYFRQYEEVHPFIDGNGRTGSILYNWLRGSLPEPIHAPNLWDDPRRKYSGYPEP